MATALPRKIFDEAGTQSNLISFYEKHQYQSDSLHVTESPAQNKFKYG